MKIYTKTGDEGMTALFGGQRIAKSDIQVETYGTVDELSSVIGMVISVIHNHQDQIFLTHIQKNLYQCMSQLAGSKMSLSFLIQETEKLEKSIDMMDKKLIPLDHFILPQGGVEASWMHIARTVCRRAERNVVRFTKEKNIVQYLNRLSDFLFVIARTYTKNNQKIQV